MYLGWMVTSETSHNVLKISKSWENMNTTEFLVKCLFVCVEVLQPSQPDWVMTSTVSLPTTFTGQD